MPKSRGRTKADKKRAKNRRRQAARARGETPVRLATPADVAAQVDPDSLEQALRRGMARGAGLLPLPDQTAIERVARSVRRELRTLGGKP